MHAPGSSLSTSQIFVKFLRNTVKQYHTVHFPDGEANSGTQSNVLSLRPRHQHRMYTESVLLLVHRGGSHGAGVWGRK